jgi:hypothetical protein
VIKSNKQTSNLPDTTQTSKTFANEKSPSVYSFRNLSPNMIITFTACIADKSKNAEDAKNKNLTSDEATTHKTLAENLLQNKRSQIVIGMPLPNAFSEDLRHEWAKETGIAKDAASKLGSVLGKYGGGAGDVAMKALQETAAKSGTRVPGADPGYFQKYSGTECRTFSFSWDLIIESDLMARDIFTAINNFKIYSSPDQVITNAILEAPNFWLIDVSNPKLKSIHFQPVVITAVTVDYAGSGMMDLYFDGTPKYLKLTVACSEISAMTKQLFGKEKYDPTTDSLDALDVASTGMTNAIKAGGNFIEDAAVSAGKGITGLLTPDPAADPAAK